jgi:hypothetical protein
MSVRRERKVVTGHAEGLADMRLAVEVAPHPGDRPM